MTTSAEDRFWSRVRIGDDCWEWDSAAGTEKYGFVRFRGRPRSAHSVAFELAGGEIPEGHVVCHTCDNPPCVRPSHLFVGTHQDNVNDMKAKGRAPRTRGKRRKPIPGTFGHRLREARLAAGYTSTALAREVGLNPMLISRYELDGTKARKVDNVIALAKASEWRERGGGRTWSYTHSWRRVPRSAWGEVSVLASVETPADARRARLQGYAPAIVVESHPSERAYEMDGLRVVPCPYETRGVSCVRCRLCLDADGLRERGVTIGFAVHGVQRERAKRRLRVLRAEAA